MHHLFTPKLSDLPHNAGVCSVSTQSWRLRTFLINARSVCNKFNEFRLFIDTEMPHIVAITETWLTADVPNAMFVPVESYLCFRKDRLSSRGGGIFLMVKKTSYITVHQVPLWSNYDHVELICVELSDRFITFSCNSCLQTSRL